MLKKLLALCTLIERYFCVLCTRCHFQQSHLASTLCFIEVFDTSFQCALILCAYACAYFAILSLVACLDNVYELIDRWNNLHRCLGHISENDKSVTDFIFPSCFKPTNILHELSFCPHSCLRGGTLPWWPNCVLSISLKYCKRNSEHHLWAALIVWWSYKCAHVHAPKEISANTRTHIQIMWHLWVDCSEHVIVSVLFLFLFLLPQSVLVFNIQSAPYGILYRTIFNLFHLLLASIPCLLVVRLQPKYFSLILCVFLSSMWLLFVSAFLSSSNEFCIAR